MSSEGYHEPVELLSEKTKDLHRAIVSLIEELEAVDWYNQRAEACTDPELRAVLLHHRDEEIEHGMMNLEWIRRREEAFDRNLKTYLFSSGDITQIEAAKTGGPADRGSIEEPGGGGSSGGGSLNLGSLRGK
jgi:ferritin-like protein